MVDQGRLVAGRERAALAGWPDHSRPAARHGRLVKSRQLPAVNAVAGNPVRDGNRQREARSRGRARWKVGRGGYTGPRTGWWNCDPGSQPGRRSNMGGAFTGDLLDHSSQALVVVWDEAVDGLC